MLCQKRKKKKKKKRREKEGKIKEKGRNEKKIQGHLLDHFKQRIKTVWYIRSSIFQSL